MKKYLEKFPTEWFILVVILSPVLLWQRDNISLEYTWLYRWPLFLAALGVLTAYRIRQISWFLVPAVAYFIPQAAYFSFVTILDPQKYLQQSYWLKMGAGSSLASMVLLLVFFGGVNLCKKTYYLLSFLGLFSALTMIAVSHPERISPILLNASIAGTFVAITMPFFPLWCAVVMLSGIILTKASVPLIGALIGLMVKYFEWTKRKVIVFTLIITSCVMPFILFKDYRGDNGRYHVWKLAYDWTTSGGMARLLCGSGAGSTPVLMPLLQLGAGDDPSGGFFFLWLHNEWVQIFMEQGVIGLACALLVVLGAVIKSRHDRVKLSFILTYCAVSCANFPMRYPIPALFGVAVLSLIYHEETYDV